MTDDKRTYLQGQIEQMTYFNEVNYTVAKVKVYGRRELVTVIGNLVNPTAAIQA
jgi:exodeoxyribonuclease V alpha subunit